MLQVKSISFSYLKEKTILNASFSLEKGKSLAIIGESGCGKSTLLKLVYGLYDLDEGAIFWEDTEVLGPKYNLIPGMDFMKYLAQDFDLMPYITVAENVGKYLSNIDSDKKWNRVKELLEIVEMEDFFDVKAKYLSGGQMQRVAIARVLALEPEVLLFDEPFSHIDNFRKNSLRRKLFAYLKEKQITCLVATHDSTDVLSFADEVLVMKNGEITEYGTPKTLYQNPKSKYIASLFGDVNELKIDGKQKYIYPHQFEIVDKSDIKVEVLNSYFRGSHYLIEAKLNNEILFFENNSEIKKATQVHLKIK
ncbi:ABC transporter ATP-binding protein [Flavobacterium aquatile]|uniref:ABC transporter ATP-binding protein n=1 Tax=Flavobacterium aquatile LMG 4008 = ATCC 11947 TaxID=1453498 RepID=A0A095SV18_9FLAO|nr:ABC transporter ATP-binding protein [Flavobacterium aquatile]KGD68204.1 ABC transporter ATP-binding protein [Flavobacterium aquatile LMG 4008 = ATCC 11947]OXA68862.1 ABC transporter ATP-binding protein [Flavobacterium aquatile LMG 4008 = ATCC 11947]GEC77325.1 ABC transporter ATP-binding protein [Flavobacterium aquatile]